MCLFNYAGDRHTSEIRKWVRKKEKEVIYNLLSRVITLCLHVFLRRGFHLCFVFFSLKEVKTLVTWSCPALCNTMDSSVHGILQARILKWVAIPFSRGFSWPRDWTLISHTGGRFLAVWATREAHILVTTVKFQCHLTFCNDIGLLFFPGKNTF